MIVTSDGKKLRVERKGESIDNEEWREMRGAIASLWYYLTTSKWLEAVFFGLFKGCVP